MDRIIKKKGRKWKRVIGILSLPFLAIFVYLLVHSFGKRTIRLDADSIQIAVVEQGNFEEFIVVTGTVEPLKTRIIVALEGGIVEEKYLEDGVKVVAGDLLLKLSNQDLVRECMNQETALLDQLNNLRNSQIIIEQSNYNYQQQYFDLEKDYLKAKTMYEANIGLYKDKLISGNEFLESERLYHSLEKRYQLLKEASSGHTKFKQHQSQQLELSSALIQKNLENLRNSLEKLVIKAPADGLVTGLQAEIGQNIMKGEKVAEVDLLKGYRLNAQVDQIYIARIKKGLKAMATFGGKQFWLEVDKIYPQVNEGQFRVDLIFKEESPISLKYGQSVQVKLALGEPQESLLLKRGGFIQTTGGSWVFVLEGDKGIKRNVTLGRQNPDYHEVIDGLKRGENVIVSSYDLFDNAEEIYINSN